jgi:hypothetical protein
MIEMPHLRRILPFGPLLGVVALLGVAHVGSAATGTSAPPKCSSFGPTWARAYNTRASKDGNPVRIISACCKPTAKFGVNGCLVTVTLAGTTDRGCAYYDISSNGSLGPGRHETCAPQN